MPVAPAHELPLVHFRKAYCTLAGATLTHSAQDYLAAAAEFDAAKAAWLAIPVAKKERPLPVPVAIMVLAPVARLQTNPAGAALDSLRPALTAATQNASCDSYVAPLEMCRQTVRLGELWRAHLAANSGDWTTAGAVFTNLHAAGWADWAKGRQAFLSLDYGAAVTSYQAAVNAWRSAQSVNLSVLERLEPKPDLSQTLTDLGGAQLLVDSAAAAIATLTEAANANPMNSRAIYLRARAKEAAGHSEAALDDYNLASRTAFADERDARIAEGHLYRGILLYRNKQFTRAENEFTSSLNAQPSTGLRGDVTAWKRLSAVAGGSCGASRTALDQSLAGVSPYFPKAEARAAAASCDGSAPLN